MNKKMRDWCIFCVAVAGIMMAFIGTAYAGYKAGMDDLKDNKRIVESTDVAKKEPVNIVIDSSVLPEDYILTVGFGDAELIYNTTITKFTYNDDGSYIAETSLGNKIIFDDGMCTIERSDNLIEVFTEYSFVLKYRRNSALTGKEADHE